MDPAAWTKSQQPVFQTSVATSVYGPGHNSFVLAEDGKTDLMLYHSRDYQQLQGSALTDPNRHARIRLLGWDAEGWPLFRPEQPD